MFRFTKQGSQLTNNLMIINFDELYIHTQVQDNRIHHTLCAALSLIEGKRGSTIWIIKMLYNETKCTQLHVCSKEKIKCCEYRTNYNDQ